MKKMNKKGFTIVELVIVIAVIAILAAVMIPTFSGIVEKAKKSAALQEARNTYTMYLGNYTYTDDNYIVKGQIEAGGYYFKVENGALDTVAAASSYSTDSYPIIDPDA